MRVPPTGGAIRRNAFNLLQSRWLLSWMINRHDGGRNLDRKRLHT